jgi:hypothetical protein
MEGVMAESLKIDELELKPLVVLMYHDLQEFKAETKSNFQDARNDIQRFEMI